MPWTDANGISIHFELAGNGPSVVLLHEMGGTLDSWDGIFPALSKRFRVLRYDQRGSGLTEKVRDITTEILVEDLEAMLQGSTLPPPYHFVTVAAATMQALIYMTRYPDRIASFVFCNPFTGADPSRVAALNERAGLAERDGLRKAIPTTLDNSWPADIGDPAAYAAYRGRYLAHDPVCFAALNRSIAQPNVTQLGKDVHRPTMVVAGRLDKVRPPATSEQFAKIIPGARFELIDAVHMMPAQAPGPLLALLEDFLGAQSGSTQKKG
ncbi:MAG: 3-oxoadipate enol-lactonase [Alphaproteobacteria bacterium]|nr:3-oxoadipate enol-lactonase [Alphaproteobacteria bacterium]